MFHIIWYIMKLMFLALAYIVNAAATLIVTIIGSIINNIFKKRGN